MEESRTKNKDHNCGPCGKSFSQAGGLKRHIHTVHEGHKDHKCESCGKLFGHLGSLKNHFYTIHKGHKITNVNLVVNHFLKEER